MPTIDRVNGWEIHPRADGGYGVNDAHGMVEGPFGTKEEAMAAALRLPASVSAIKVPPRTSEIRGMRDHARR